MYCSREYFSARFATSLSVGILCLCLVPFGQAADAIFEPLASSAQPSFRHENGMTGGYFIHEMMGPGAALFDYDGDGDLDLYLVQGGPLTKEGRVPQGEAAKRSPLDRLWRNDIASNPTSNSQPKFTDVTEKAGIRANGYGFGVAVGDANGDGLPDLYLTNMGPNQLWMNRGNGTFTEAGTKAGVVGNDWSTSAAWVDVDRDGHQDLIVVNYVQIPPKAFPKCYAPNSSLDYCGPDAFTPAKDRLYRNRGDGTFEDWSAKFVAAQAGAGLGIVSLDANGDGFLDLYIANDGDPNHLWVNQGKGQLSESAFEMGLAVNGLGLAEAGMGVTAGDFDNDGDEDLFVTHLSEETNTLYVQGMGHFFDDETNLRGLGISSFAMTGFGTRWLDIDNDSWLDLVAVNGAVRVLTDQKNKGNPHPLNQINQIFLNQKGKRFREATKEGGPIFAQAEVSRGAAFGDIDNDGDTDLVICQNLGPVAIYLNQQGHKASWLGVVPKAGKQIAAGARVSVSLKDGRILRRWSRRNGSYLSSNDPRVLFGLGSAKSVKHVSVRWQDGTEEVWTGLKLGSYTTLTRGTGQPEVK